MEGKSTLSLRLECFGSKSALFLFASLLFCALIGNSLIAMDYDDISYENSSLSLNKGYDIAQDSWIQVIDNDDLINKYGPTPVIANMTISESGPYGHGIEIRNTYTSLTIQNITILGVSDCGIWLSNVQNCDIIDITCIENSDAGLRAIDCSSISISFSNFSDNHYGVDVLGTTSLNMENSSCSDNFTCLQVDETSSSCSFQYNSFECAATSIDVIDDDGSKSNSFLMNFYSGYEGVDIHTKNGIGDTPYMISGLAGNQDPQPMMLPPDRPPLSWIVYPSYPLHEFGFDVYLPLKARIYGGLSEWTINCSSFSISQVGVITNLEWLAIGEYGINVQVSNLYGNILEADFSITVQDNVKPQWVDVPSRIYCELGENFLYQVQAYDLAQPLLFSLIDTPNFEIDASTGIITNNSSLDYVTDYYVEVWVRDFNYNYNNTILTISVVDTTPPLWVKPPIDINLEFDEDIYFDVNATDISGIASYGIDDVYNFQININGTITNSTPLSVGTYPLTVWAQDNYGNQVTKQIDINIIDSTPPIWIVRPSIHQVEYGDIFDIQVLAWDATGVSYYTVSNPEVFDVTLDGRILSYLPLDKKTYSLNVTCYDLYGNSVSAPFSVVVVDREGPIWLQEVKSLTVELDTALNVQLAAYDPSGIDEWYVDETNFFMITENGVLKNATYLTVRSYNIHVRVSDPDGHVLLGLISLHVVDTTPPLWNILVREFNVTFPNTFSLLLKARDLSGVDHWTINNTDAFSVTRAGRLVSGIILPGVYHLIITAYDPYNNSASTTITVTVRLADAGFFIITGTVGVAFVCCFTLIVCMFDPKRGKIGFAKGGGSK